MFITQLLYIVGIQYIQNKPQFSGKKTTTTGEMTPKTQQDHPPLYLPSVYCAELVRL